MIAYNQLTEKEKPVARQIFRKYFVTTINGFIEEAVTEQEKFDLEMDKENQIYFRQLLELTLWVHDLNLITGQKVLDYLGCFNKHGEYLI